MTGMPNGMGGGEREIEFPRLDFKRILGEAWRR